MADGTRFQTIERRLDNQERSVEEIGENLKKGQEENRGKLEDLEKSMEEIKNAMLKLCQDKGKGAMPHISSTTAQGERIGENRGSPESQNQPPPPGVSLHLPSPPLTPGPSNYHNLIYPGPTQQTNHRFPNQPPPQTEPHFHNRPSPNIHSFHIQPPTNPQSMPPQTPPYIPPHHQPPYLHQQTQNNPHQPHHQTQYQHYQQWQNLPQNAYPNPYLQGGWQGQHNPVWHHTKPPKMDFPKFEGNDPRGWVIKGNQYFDFNPMDDLMKAKFASTYFEGRALNWYQYYQPARDGVPWDVFAAEVIHRFTFTEHQDPQAEFNKLKQTGTVEMYLVAFEELRAHIVAKQPGLSEEYFISSFISGLKDEIRGAVNMARPTTFKEVVTLAKQAELNLNAAKPKFSSVFKPTNPKPTYSKPYTLNPNPRTEPRRLGSRTLSPTEISERRKKGLCFHCDEKYSGGHVCKVKLYMLAGEEETPEFTVIEEEEIAYEEAEVEPDGENCQISIQSLTGTLTHSTIKVKGLVKKKHGVTALIDSGATHNFIDSQTVKRLGLEELVTNPLAVTVADGNKMVTSTICQDFVWYMQGQEFKANLRVLPLGGCDLVLGVEWLKQNSPVTFDYQKTEITLFVKKRRVVLKGITEEGSLKIISGKGLDRLIKKARDGLVGYLFYMNAQFCDEGIPIGVKEVVQQFKEVFKEPKELPPVRRHDHKIPLKEGSQPISQRPYRTPYIQKAEIEKQVKEMLKAGIIQYSNSPFASPVLLVLKKDGSWRLCVDYRKLNEMTIKDKFLIPVIEELLDELNGARWFTKLDLRAGYHQIRVSLEDIPKTAFRTHHGHFEFKVMPFGLTNAPASFQSLMNEVFEPLLRKSVLVFFDDILIYSHSWGEHVKHLKEVLSLMHEHKLFAKLSKCSFGQESLEYLGHIISKEGVAADPQKIEVMNSWPTPTTIKQLRGFLGLTGYYRRFVKGYGVIAKPLTQLLKKNAYKWDDDAQSAFNRLKMAMSSTPVLAMPDFSIPFVVETDASNHGIGAVLMQKGQPIAYLSKGLSKKNLSLSTYEKELLAIILAITKWRAYLQGHHFIIKTDQQSLKYFLEQRVTSLLQQKWLAKLMGLDYEIQYKKGVENKVADALSRVPSEEGDLHEVTVAVPTWLSEIQSSYEGDASAQEFLLSAADQVNNGGWTLKQGLLRKDGRIYVGSTGSLRTDVISEFHSGGIAGHSGRDVTIKRVQQFFYWPTMVEEIKLTVRECNVCQLNKGEHVPSPGLLQPLPIPDSVWEDIAMDLVEGLPKSYGKNLILVVVDRLSKYAHFIALTHPISAIQLAQVFLDNIYKLHGLPKTIVSDRDRLFLSKFWQELFKLMGTRLNFSTAYHPQTDGQSERVNQCVENYLRLMTGQRPKEWSKWLPLAEWWYNTSPHTAIKMTPFEALYGVVPKQLNLPTPNSAKVISVGEFFRSRNVMNSILKESIAQAQNRYKQLSDKGRTEREFNVGDWVYLKLQPYRQHTVVLRTNHKLSSKYYGPFLITQKIGKVAYRLDLPSYSQIHPTFHVSLLKKKIGKGSTVTVELPNVGDDGQLLIKPMAILERRTVKRNNCAVPQLLIQWASTGPEEATWEDAAAIDTQFPDFLP